MNKRTAVAIMHWMHQRYSDNMRLAVASSDGKNVDSHLGKAKSLYIYDYDGDLKFSEVREVEISDDSKHQGGKVIQTCSDCDVLISVQYGFKSKIRAEDAGIKLVTDSGPVDEVLKRYIDHVEFMKN